MIKRRNLIASHRDTFTMQYRRDAGVASAVFGIAPCDCELVAVKEVHSGASSASGAVTMTLEKLNHSEALGSGNTLLTGTMNLKGTADTVQSGTLISAGRDKVLQPFITKFAAGDRIAVIVSGDTPNLTGTILTAYFRPIDGGEVIVSPSPSPSPSASASASSSSSPSASASPSSSLSPSASNSPSPSASASPSSSSSTSSSVSNSASPSASVSKSPSASASPSSSVSPSKSSSASASPSASVSKSSSASLSPSASISPSGSASASPSPGE